MVDGGLIGRDKALTRLRGVVDAALGGRGRFELIVGEAGIGKTALAIEVADYAAGRGMAVLWATCWDGEGAPAFWPWVQLLREYEAVSGRRWTDGPQAEKLARVSGTWTGPAGGSSWATQTGGERERFGLFDGVATLLTGAARVRPLLVVVDDLQWADVPSLILLNFVASQVVTAPLVLLGALRDDDVSVAGARRELLDRTRGLGGVSALSGLDSAGRGSVDGDCGGCTGAGRRGGRGESADRRQPVLRP